MKKNHFEFSQTFHYSCGGGVVKNINPGFLSNFVQIKCSWTKVTVRGYIIYGGWGGKRAIYAPGHGCFRNKL